MIQTKKITYLSLSLTALTLLAGCTQTQPVATNANTVVVPANENVNVGNANSNVTNTNAAAVDTSDWKTYTNTTLGFSLKYPAGWKFEEGTVDPVTHGPIMKDGKVYTSYGASLVDNNTPWKAIIGIHTGGTYLDNISIDKSLQLQSCDTNNASEVSCDEIINAYGTKYVRSVTKSPGGDELGAGVPTGQYTIGFSINFSDNLDLHASEHVNAIKIFDTILSTVQLTK